MTANPLRDASEVQVGRITNDGTWDRRYRRPSGLIVERPEPVEVNLVTEWAKILGLAAYIIVLFAVIIVGFAVLAASYPVPVR
jgi:hypothetical protein